VTPCFIVRPAAEVDIAEAALWYESRSLGLGAEFLRARFPYAVYFVSAATAIRVLACMHAKRDPRRWQRRVDR
jgi:hypothetical protein